ncbi:MAG: S41 family peptidase [Bacteroidota bacterium]
MKMLFTIFFTTIFSLTLIAQEATCNCKQDLDFLVQKMREMPSYKHQIVKTNKEDHFQSTYQLYADKMTQPISIIVCFDYLNKMMGSITDLHASVQYEGDGLTKDQLANPSTLQSFLASETFVSHPKTSAHLETLSKLLPLKQENDIEGIYMGREITVGVYQTDDPSKLEGVVLTSKLETWIPGQIIFYLTQNGNGRYDILYFSPKSRKMYYSKGISASNGRIKYFLKEGIESNEINFSKDKWVFEQLSDSVQYIYFGEFSNTASVKQASKDFYAKLKDLLGAEHLIIDLRNNGGGNKKHSDLFLKLFKRNKGNNYILTNSFTASNAEQFTTKLKKIPNTIHLGETTKGVLAYGKNYGYRYDTPSGLFSVQPTDMDFHKAYFQYEGKGISPDLPLNYDVDWILQTLEIIETQSKL